MMKKKNGTTKKNSTIKKEVIKKKQRQDVRTLISFKKNYKTGCIEISWDD